MIILYVRYRAVGGGFWQNELILEFPTKSMPSGFRAAAIAIIRLFPRNRGEATVHCVSSFAGACTRVCEAVLLPASPRPRGAVTGRNNSHVLSKLDRRSGGLGGSVRRQRRRAGLGRLEVSRFQRAVAPDRRPWPI